MNQNNPINNVLESAAEGPCIFCQKPAVGMVGDDIAGKGGYYQQDYTHIPAPIIELSQSM